MGDPEALAALGGGDQSLAPPIAPPPTEPPEVEVAWQEILSLSELQGLDMSADPPFDPSFYPLPSPSPYPHLPPPLHAPPPPHFPPTFLPPFPSPALPPTFPPPPPPPPPAPHPLPHPAAPRPSDLGTPSGTGTPSSRDARRALALALPLGPDAIVNLPVEAFNAALGRARLSAPALALARDIRRRGKNKVAAQKCRRRKLETIARLQAELGRLGKEREKLLRARGQAEKALGTLRKELEKVSAQVLGALRDGAGNPLPPDGFGLRLAPDGGFSLESPGLGDAR